MAGFMKAFLALLLEKLAAISQRILGGRKTSPPIPCQFCGDTTHDTSDCPNAAKYKLFNVDRE
jgi:hypothetical protein